MLLYHSIPMISDNRHCSKISFRVDSYHWCGINSLSFSVIAQDNNLPVQVCICTAPQQYVWLGILFAYKGILLTIGVFLAFETRNVKIRHLNDSHLIGMCVYATVVLSIALAPIGMLLENNVDMYYAVIGFMVLFGTTLILSLLFVPKVSSISNLP